MGYRNKDYIRTWINTAQEKKLNIRSLNTLHLHLHYTLLLHLAIRQKVLPMAPVCPERYYDTQFKHGFPMVLIFKLTRAHFYCNQVW